MFDIHVHLQYVFSSYYATSYFLLDKACRCSSNSGINIDSVGTIKTTRKQRCWWWWTKQKLSLRWPWLEIRNKNFSHSAHLSYLSLSLSHFSVWHYGFIGITKSDCITKSLFLILFFVHILSIFVVVVVWNWKLKIHSGCFYCEMLHQFS